MPVKKDIVFLCSPHIGIIDNWLPVLWELKKRIGDTHNFICIVPKTSWINESALQNALIKLSDKVFDKIILKNPYDDWVVVDSFVDANDFLKSNKKSGRLVEFANVLKNFSLFRYLGIVIIKSKHYYKKFKMRERAVNFEVLFKDSVCLIYDLGQELKMENKFFLKNLEKVPKFSLFHGLITHPVDFKSADNDKYTVQNVTAYLFSEKEIPHYRERFGLKNEQMKVIGVPRHAPAWIETLMEHQGDCQANNYGDYIFIISRPYDSSRLPRERMKSTLQEIKKIAFEELDVNIVIKLHPSEYKQDIYEEVFGENEKGNKWFYSSSHPLVLGKNAIFAISFYSGIAVDLVSMNIPVIEKLDLRNIRTYENDSEMKDENGEPVLRYRYYNLLLGASSNKQLRNSVNEIMSDRNKVSHKLKTNYRKIYPIHDKVNSEVASDIIKSIDNIFDDKSI